jgi:FtsH-binding integral membrane protein
MDLKATALSSEVALEVQRSFIARVYRWMFVGLGTTAVVAYAVTQSPQILSALFSNRLLYMGLLGGELLLVMALAGLVQRLSSGVAGALFFLYAALNGVTFSVLLLAFTPGSVAQAFLVSAGLFGGMSIYASTTRSNLSGWSTFLFTGLFGIVGAGLVNLFLHSSALSFVLSCASVVVFTGLTAYDTQKLRALALSLEGEQEGRMAIVGALSLYLDFVNLFLSLLRLFGRRR